MANLGADALRTRGRPQRARHYGKAYTHLAGAKPLAGMATSCAGLGRPCVGLAHRSKARMGNQKDTTVTHGRRESDSSTVPVKRPNQGSQQRLRTSRPRQQRRRSWREELAKGPAGQHNRGRTPCRAALSRALDRGRQAARESAIRLTARWHPVYAMDRLRRHTTASITSSAGRGWPDMGRLRRAPRHQPAGVVRPRAAGSVSGSTGRARVYPPAEGGASAPSASRRWKTTSSSGRQSRCSTPSTRKRVSGSRPVPAQDAARTTRWMRSRSGWKAHQRGTRCRHSWL